MKHINILLIITLLFGSVGVIDAQRGKAEEVRVPLTSPGEEGMLDASSHRGSIKVEAHSGKDVIVKLYPDDDDYDEYRSGKKSGLKKISAGSFSADIEEDDNYVHIRTGSQNEVHMEILVPANFSLKLGTHHNGLVTVENVKGDIEVNAHHGSVELRGLGSSASVNTHHGEIVATFDNIDNSKPMAFTTYHGDVDLTLPPNVNFISKIKTTKGDIYTDFEMDVTSQNPSYEKGKGKDERTRIKIGGWRNAVVGSGGVEYMMSTYHGDIIIRKND